VSLCSGRLQLRAVEIGTDAYPMRVPMMFSEIEVPVIDRASLIMNKRALGRRRDLDDAKDLEDDDAPQHRAGRSQGAAR
jgi:hypothetical protein